jgi:hypothetical protein
MPTSELVFLSHPSDPYKVIGADGREYSTGCLPRFTEPGECPNLFGGRRRRFPIWDPDEDADNCPLVDLAAIQTQEPTEWCEYEDLDQNGFPSCSLFASGNGIQLFLTANGRKQTPLDPHKAWIECTGGRGGYGIDQALTYMSQKGFPCRDGSRIFVKEAWDCPTAHTVVSARARGFFVVYGRFAPGGHAECGAWMKRVGTGPKDLVQVCRGSYGRDTGTRGYYDVSYASLEQGVPSFGAFAIRELEIRSVDMEGLTDAQ